MVDGEISRAQSFHGSFFRFVGALVRLSGEPRDLHWEVQHDLLESGAAVLRNASPFLMQAFVADIASTLAKVKSLPPEALAAGGSDPVHPQWDQLRGDAASLLFRLADPIAVNVSFLAQQVCEVRR